MYIDFDYVKIGQNIGSEVELCFKTFQQNKITKLCLKGANRQKFILLQMIYQVFLIIVFNEER